ncbi:MAG: hypothetical protein B7X12_02595 [Halothiobacillus sp. 20-53-49]|nr:MAG: hypothetical protein B7X12_02595 [Halothiobacillus sp. 20-53-49]
MNNAGRQQGEQNPLGRGRSVKEFGGSVIQSAHYFITVQQKHGRHNQLTLPRECLHHADFFR